MTANGSGWFILEERDGKLKLTSDTGFLQYVQASWEKVASPFGFFIQTLLLRTNTS